MTRRGGNAAPGGRNAEANIQAAILEALRLGWPDVLVASVPNGGYVMDPRAVARLKWQGLHPGFPDLALYWRGDCGLIEVKAPRGRVSPEQKQVHERLIALGHHVAVVRSIDDLTATMTAWGRPGRLRAA